MTEFAVTLPDRQTNGHAAVPASDTRWARVERRIGELAAGGERRIAVLRDALGDFVAAGGAALTILNAANEIAVREFVGRRLGFGGIPALVEATLEAAARQGSMAEPQSIEDALAIDEGARRLAVSLLPEIAAMAS